MEKNFTPLKINTNQFSSNEKILNAFNKFSLIFFIFSFSFFIINALIPNLLKYTSQKTKASLNINPKIYQSKYNTIDQLNFIPRKINNISLDKEDIYNYFKSKYPSSAEEDLIKIINRKIFSYIIINNQTNLDLLINFDGQTFEKEMKNSLNVYQAKTKKATFYYFKTRFKGATQENLSHLNLNDEQTKDFASKKINYYHQLNLQPNVLMKQFNNDSEILYLNNKEKSAERIENYDFNTPIFDDPNFYNLLINSPVNQYSDVYLLKTKNPYSSQEEEYLFIFFFVEKIDGENVPLDIAINNFIAQSQIF
jgi:hypothetical protein